MNDFATIAAIAADDLKQNRAAVRIQSLFRGFIFRYHVLMETYQQKSAKKIQNAWRSHVIRQKLRRIQEIIALSKISRVILLYRNKINATKEMNHLRQFDNLLTFYPARSMPPEPKRSRLSRTSKRGKSSAVNIGIINPRSRTMTSRAVNSRSLTTRQAQTSISAKASTSSLQVITVPATRSKTSTGNRVKRKRVTFIELPPPWHNKDPRRVSASQQDELLFTQKANFAWAKQELIPLLLRRCSTELDKRDELVARNDRFIHRTISKSFLWCTSRNTAGTLLKNPIEIKFVNGASIYQLVNLTGMARCIANEFADDKVFNKDSFCISNPLYDTAICPTSGQVLAIDNNWTIHLIDKARPIMHLDLNEFVPNKIPKAKKYLTFDSFGLLWVNLVPQKGNIFCIDPLTLQPTLIVSLDSLCATHSYFRTNVTMQPIAFGNQPLGFACTFSQSQDVVLFSSDFIRSKKLVHKDVEGFPVVHVSQKRLFVTFSSGRVFIYDLGDRLELVILAGTIDVPYAPTAVDATLAPDFIYVGCDDGHVRVFLGHGTDFSLQVNTKRMTHEEAKYAARMLGPPVVTKTRSQFCEMGSIRFTSTPVKLTATSITDKLGLVAVAFQNGNSSSAWFFNDAQQVTAAEFDSFEYYNPLESHSNAVAEFHQVKSKIEKDVMHTIDMLRFFQNYDSAANQGIITNMFNEGEGKFSLLKLIASNNIRQYFPFLPETEKGLTSYEIYHFFYRAGVLPPTMIPFSKFVDRLTEPLNKRPILPLESLINYRLPAYTSGPYEAIFATSLTLQQTQALLHDINPLTNLNNTLGKYTLTSISKSVSDPEAITTRSRWNAQYQKSEFNKRLLQLTTLEDQVKHELMGRINHKTNKSFIQHQLDKMVPVPNIDIHQIPVNNDIKSIEFTDKANRNPLLDECRHISIYDSWSKYSLFGCEKIMTTYLRALHIPRSIIENTVVVSHFEFIQRVSMASKKFSSMAYSLANIPGENTRFVVTEDIKALPLSHYLSIHSFLGGNSRLLLACRSILSKTLCNIYPLHKNGIILRTLCPSNVLLNATTGNVTIGSVYDCQQVSGSNRALYLPLPPDFGNPSNPFLPPEYFHEPPRKFTTAFDVWQFGILLLYCMTGFLPPAYGSELLKHLEKHKKPERHVQMAKSNFLDDPPLYPKCSFFYDWLSGCHVVATTERNIGERGECFISTDNPGAPASILELENYHLLPFVNTKANYDESRLFLEIIASCLQVDPSKRPTVEQLMRTYPFNQANQIGEIMEQYTRNPDPNIFVSQFFAPVLSNLGDSTFTFCLGIISSLIFAEENLEEDAAYSFPLDSHSTDRVVNTLFSLKFMDKLVKYVLTRVGNRIQISDVNPVVKFKDEAFDALLHFFMRFIIAVDHGQGVLISKVDEVVLSLFALYAANPYLRHPSSELLANKEDSFALASHDSAAVYVFTYHQTHSLVRYVLQGSTFIPNALKRNAEHNDAYFNQFLSFSEAISSFASAMCHSIDKQRANAVRTMSTLWQGGGSPSLVRLFIDLRVPQKVIHCMHTHSARLDAANFIISAFAAIKAKSFDPTYMLLSECLRCPPIPQHCSLVIRQTTHGIDTVKPSFLQIIKHILFGESASSISSLMQNDVIWSLAENAKDPTIFEMFTEAMQVASVFVMQTINCSPSLQKTLRSQGIEILPQIDYRLFNGSLDLNESLTLAKLLSTTLFIRQSAIPQSLASDPPPISIASSFLVSTLNLTFKEADNCAKFLDSQIIRETKFDLKGTTFLKAKNKAKETSFAQTQSTITEMNEVLLHLFRCLCFYWRSENSSIPSDLFNYIIKTILSPIPQCKSMLHPASFIHHCLQNMALHCLTEMPQNSPAKTAMLPVEENWTKVMLRDLSFVQHCIEKDTVEMQLMVRYNEERQIRKRMFQAILNDRQFVFLAPIIHYIANDMLHNTIKFKLDSSISKESYEYPMRSEAVSMILTLISSPEKYEIPIKKLGEELKACNFLDKERKLTELPNNHELINSSILLLRSLTICPGLADEDEMKRIESLLESLCMRYSREWMSMISITTPEDDTKSEKKKRNNNKASTTVPTSRPLTSIQKKQSTTVTVHSKPKGGRASTSVEIKRPVTSMK